MREYNENETIKVARKLIDLINDRKINRFEFSDDDIKKYFNEPISEYVWDLLSVKNELYGKPLIYEKTKLYETTYALITWDEWERREKKNGRL